jgi:hypothetical protein
MVSSSWITHVSTVILAAGWRLIPSSRCFCSCTLPDTLMISSGPSSHSCSLAGVQSPPALTMAWPCHAHVITRFSCEFREPAVAHESCKDGAHVSRCESACWQHKCICVCARPVQQAPKLICGGMQVGSMSAVTAQPTTREYRIEAIQATLSCPTCAHTMDATVHTKCIAKVHLNTAQDLRLRMSSARA